MKILPEGVKTYWREECRDLVAAASPRRHAGEYVIYEKEVPANQVLLIKGVIPYVMERTEVGTPGVESARLLSAYEAARFCVFEPYINDASPFPADGDLNRMSPVASPEDVTNRQRSRGFSHVSEDPFKDAMAALRDSLYQITVPGDSTFKVIFRIPPVATNFRTFSVGTGPKRIDFAGCLVVGLQMSETTYQSLSSKGLE